MNHVICRRCGGTPLMSKALHITEAGGWLCFPDAEALARELEARGDVPGMAMIRASLLVRDWHGKEWRD